jgi:hypothetical protein
MKLMNSITRFSRPAASLSARINWLLIGTVALTLFYISPLLHTGFLADDAGSSLVRGITRYYDITIYQLIIGDIKAWLAQARFFPLASVYIYMTFYLIPSLFLYKIFIIGLILLDLLLFHQLVRRICPLAGLAEFSLLLIIMLFQFRIYHDPILGFAGFLQFILLDVLLSLLCLCLYLDLMKPRWLIASVMLYLVGLLTYEMTYPLFLLHFLCARHYTRSWKQAMRTTAPFFALAALCASACVFLRVILGRTVHPAYAPNTDVSLFLFTLSKQLFASLPLSYALTAGGGYLPAWPRLGQGLPALACFAASLVIAFASLREMARDRARCESVTSLRTLPLAIALWVLPGLLVCLSPRYQQEIYWGVGQLPVYIECFGLGLLLASAVAFFANRLLFRTGLYRVWAILASLTVATVLAINGHINHRIAQRWGFGWYHERVQVEAALAAGLAEGVPDGSSVIPGHKYPWWHDVFGSYFYSLHAGKRLYFPATIHLGPKFPLFQGGSSGNFEHLTANGRCYEVHDFPIDSSSVGVFLCELAQPGALTNGEPLSHKTANGRLYIRQWSRRSQQERVDQALLITADADGSVFSVRSDRCKLLRRGKGWRLYSLETGDRLIDARSLRVLPCSGQQTH